MIFEEDIIVSSALCAGSVLTVQLSIDCDRAVGEARCRIRLTPVCPDPGPPPSQDELVRPAPLLLSQLQPIADDIAVPINDVLSPLLSPHASDVGIEMHPHIPTPAPFHSPQKAVARKKGHAADSTPIAPLPSHSPTSVPCDVPGLIDTIAAPTGGDETPDRTPGHGNSAHSAVNSMVEEYKDGELAAGKECVIVAVEGVLHDIISSIDMGRCTAEGMPSDSPSRDPDWSTLSPTLSCTSTPALHPTMDQFPSPAFLQISAPFSPDSGASHQRTACSIPCSPHPVPTHGPAETLGCDVSPNPPAISVIPPVISRGAYVPMTIVSPPPGEVMEGEGLPFNMTATQCSSSGNACPGLEDACLSLSVYSGFTEK